MFMDLPTFVTFMVRHLIDLAHKEHMSALDRGLQALLPPPCGSGADPQAQPAYYLHRGLMSTLLGLSFMVALGVNVSEKSALWGLPLAA
jgi:hypothetical protein